MNDFQTIHQWGNSTGVRLTKKVMESAGWHENQALEVTVKGHTVVLKPTTLGPTMTLEKLLEEVTPQNLHSELDWGPPAGKELL